MVVNSAVPVELDADNLIKEANVENLDLAQFASSSVRPDLVSDEALVALKSLVKSDIDSKNYSQSACNISLSTLNNDAAAVLNFKDDLQHPKTGDGDAIDIKVMRNADVSNGEATSVLDFSVHDGGKVYGVGALIRQLDLVSANSAGAAMNVFSSQGKGGVFWRR